jgi:hypothetical protein
VLSARDFTASTAEYNAWVRVLTRTHQRRVVVRVLDLEDKVLSYIDKVIDGQVTIDVSNRECTRVANVTLLDPTRSIGWEPDHPSSLPIHQRRMIQIIDFRRVPGHDWIGVPVFTGPVVDMDRDGAQVSIVAEGKERLALGSFGRTKTWPKGRKVTEVIREMLELAGEAPNRIHLPAYKGTIGAHGVTVTRTDRPWVAARRLAEARDFKLFYDGRGHVVMRKAPGKSLWNFNRDWLLGALRLDRHKLVFHNGFIILGPKPPKNKTRISSGLIGLPKTNDFSAYALRRRGMWRWLIHEEARQHVKTVKEAKAIANRLRDVRIRFAADVSFDALPLPIIEEWDLVKVVDPLAGVAVVQVKQATLPLVAGAMTIGSIKRIAQVRRH